MSERYANCTVHHGMHDDRRFVLLAELAGWTWGDACWRMVQLYARCTALQTDRPPSEEVRVHLGLRGEQLLLDSTLGERADDGAIRIKGGGLSGGDTDRFGWYEPVVQRNVSGGRARAEQVRQTGRGPRGRFAPALVNYDQQLHQQPTSETSQTPASYPQAPASGFRIPDSDQRSEIPPARDPAVPAPEYQPTSHEATPEASQQTDRRPDLPTRQAVRTKLMAELGAARKRVADKLRVVAQPLLAFDPGERDLADRIALIPTRRELETFLGQALHAIAMAEAETASGAKSLEWFTGAIFAERNLRRLAGKTAADLDRDQQRARAGPRGSAERAPEQAPRKIKTLTTLTTPTRDR